MKQIFRREQFNQLWLTLNSNEVLGVLDTDFVEDYFGVDGQVSLRNTLNDVRIPILMTKVDEDTLTGYVELQALSDGDYVVEGCVRDLIGNYTILTGSDNRVGNTVPFEITLTSQQVIISFPVAMPMKMGLIMSLPLSPLTVVASLSLQKTKVLTTHIKKTSVLHSSIVNSIVVQTPINKGVVLDTQMSNLLTLYSTIRILSDGN